MSIDDGEQRIVVGDCKQEIAIGISHVDNSDKRSVTAYWTHLEPGYVPVFGATIVESVNRYWVAQVAVPAETV